MYVKIALGAAIAGTLASVAVGATLVAPSADGMSAPAGRLASITQKFHCTTPVGDINENITVTGSAKASHAQLLLRRVTFTFLNDFGTDVTINKIRFSVPDPDQVNAHYQAGSAAVTKSPKGWTAGHKGVTGIFMYYPGTQVLANGGIIEVPQLSASYAASGPKGTLVEWKPGDFSFNLKSPDAGVISCSPQKPIQTFASITE